MEYKVVPFTANITRDSKASAASQQLESIINNHNNEGWEFYSMEDLTTDVAPDSGCFGIGAKPGYAVSVQCLVFRR